MIQRANNGQLSLHIHAEAKLGLTEYEKRGSCSWAMFSFKSNKKRPIDFFGILFTYECIVFLLHICVMRRCMARTKESYRIFFNNRFRYLIITCAVSSVWGFPPFLCLLFFICIIFKLKLFWFSYFIDLCYNIKLFDYAGWRYFFFLSFFRFYCFDH